MDSCFELLIFAMRTVIMSIVCIAECPDKAGIHALEGQSMECLLNYRIEHIAWARRLGIILLTTTYEGHNSSRTNHQLKPQVIASHY